MVPALLPILFSGPSNLLVAGLWTMSVAGGASTAVESPPGTLTLTGDGTNQARGDQSIATVIGRTYKITGTVVGSLTIGCAVGTSQGGIQNLNANFLGNVTTTQLFIATAATTWVRFSRTAAVAPAVITNISCR
jgi:hypothetical protein